jgi:magnesium transporter
MSESENIATAAVPEVADVLDDTILDEEDRLRPEFVDRCSTQSRPATTRPRATGRAAPPADVADLIELAARDEREGLVKALAGIVSPDVLAEMNEHVREALLDELEPQQVADLAGRWRPTTPSR